MNDSNTHNADTTHHNAAFPRTPEAHQKAGGKSKGRAKPDTEKKDLYQRITDTVIEALEQGTAPWRCPWNRGQDSGLPVNHQTGIAYRGVNIALLWVAQFERGFTSSQWLTYKQAQAMGGQVRKGEKSTLAIFYKTWEKESDRVNPETGEKQIEKIPMAKPFFLFNLDQIDGIEAPIPDTVEGEGFDAIPHAEHLIQAAGVPVLEGGIKAAYYPNQDRIIMPDRYRFTEARDYYATAFHELTHATKHASRCDRKPYETTVRKGAYAFEELVAELGALFTAGAIGLGGEVQGHDSYIASWLEVLREDKRAIFRAAAQAQTAADWLLNAADMQQARHQQAA